VALARQILEGLSDATARECRAAGPAADGAVDTLSPREREVLSLVADGLSNKELSVAERTAKYHLSSLFNKLGVSSRTQALAVARRRGLV
jgi:DNA-binding NarL/FixJ family response regulator